MSLIYLPRQLVVDVNGVPRVGAKLSVFDAGTTTPRATYPTAADAAAETNPQTHPLTSNSSGQFAPMYVVEEDGAIKIAITDADDVALAGYPVDNIPVLLFDQDSIGETLYPRTAAEIAALVTPTDYAYAPLNQHRYGFTGAGGAADTTARAAVASVLAQISAADAWINGMAVGGFRQTAAELAAGVVPVDPSVPSHEACGAVMVNRYGRNAVPGTTDMTTAFESAWMVLKAIGGRLAAAPGKYLLSDTWDIVINDGVATAYPVNYDIDGTGIELLATSAVTGPAIRLTGSYNEFSTQVRGFYFNHRNNSTIAGCVEVLGTHNAHVHHNTVEMYGVGASYYFASFDTKTAGASEDDWNAFWCCVEYNSTRKRSGGESGEIKYAIKLKGAVNAFTARKNILSNCDYGIYASPAGTTLTLPNAIVIEDNAFETIGTAAIHIQMTPAELGPTGWRVTNNRCETTTTFFSLATGGAAANEHTQPPFLIGNYCTGGSVTNWVLNPTNYPVSVLETRFPGFGPVVENKLWQTGSLALVFDNGKNLVLQDTSGTNDYSRAKLIIGTYNLWPSPSDDKLYIKNGTPANNTDGTVVGTQS